MHIARRPETIAQTPESIAKHPGAMDQDRLTEALRETARRIEATTDQLLPLPQAPERRLVEAMRYAVLGGGKRLRGFIVVQSAALLGADPAAALRVAASVEMLHAYSLVHDDLPAMDNDDLRRGKPSTHRAFDEATAILAGDALLTAALEILADPATSADAHIRSELVLALTRAAGPAGMVGGQMADMLGEGQHLAASQWSEAEVLHMQALKTGRLIQYSAEAGAILGNATTAQRRALAEYGRAAGAAFQIADDLLDTLGSTVELGKSAGKDEASGKATLVALLGADAAAARANNLAAQAVQAIDGFGEPAALLRLLAAHMVSRRS